MPDDRFGDLRRGGDRRSAAERLAELDSTGEASRDEPSEPPPPPGSRYGWVVGVAALIAAIVATLNLLDVGTGEGTSGPDPGTVLPDFAAPSIKSESELGPNVIQSGDESEGQTEACDVELVGVVNICDLRERPVVLTFAALGSLGGDVRCEDALDNVERVRRSFPGVTFVGVLSGADSDDVVDTVAEHEWGFPVANDPDGVLLSVYRIGDCPATVISKAGGEVVDTINGVLSAQELRAAAQRVSPSSGGPSA